MAMARGIGGAAIGLLSPSVIELIVFRYFRELCQVKNLSIGAVAKYVVKRFAEFNHHEYYWSVEGDMAREMFDTPPRRRKTKSKHSADHAATPSHRTQLAILHPVDQTRILTKRMTPQTSETVMRVFRSVALCDDMERFTFESDFLIATRYPEAISLKVQHVDNDAARSRIEIELYKTMHDVVKDLENTMPQCGVYPWPYFYDTVINDRREHCLTICYGHSHEIVDEEIAFHLLINDDDEGHELWDKDPSPVRKLAAKYWYSKRWFHGAGGHHRTQSKAHAGAGAMARHQHAHRAKAMRRQKLSEETRTSYGGCEGVMELETVSKVGGQCDEISLRDQE
jgi:hypothetical protein